MVSREVIVFAVMHCTQFILKCVPFVVLHKTKIGLVVHNVDQGLTPHLRYRENPSLFC